MDLPTSYGTRLLSPFDWHWYAVDLMPIIDIYLLAALGACFWFGNRLEWRRRNVVIALSLMALNYGVRIAAHRQALETAPRMFGPALARALRIGRHAGADRRSLADSRTAVRRGTQRRCLLEIAALPTFTSPFQWRLVAQLSNAYETRDVDLIDAGPAPAAGVAGSAVAPRAARSEPLDPGGAPGGPLGDRPDLPRLLALPCRAVDRRLGWRFDRAMDRRSIHRGGTAHTG